MSRTIRLAQLEDGRQVYASGPGIKFSRSSVAEDVASHVSEMSKGDRRRVRKALRRAGRQDLLNQALLQ